MRTRVLGLMLLTGCYVPLAGPEESPEHAERRPKPETSALGITIALPATTADCSDVLLAVVGAKRAVLGEHIVLEAAASDPEESLNGDDNYSLRWASPDVAVRVVGPASAEVSCNALGLHIVSVQLAPPAPCPATVNVEVECVEARRE